MERNDKSLRRFGRQLAALRKQRNLSVRELAARSGVDLRQVIRIEAGKVKLGHGLFALFLGAEVSFAIGPEAAKAIFLLDGLKRLYKPVLTSFI